MAKISNRDKILTAGLKVVLERGYVGASVRDIVEAAGVPQGSFTNHFKSKEAFALEILDIYYDTICATMTHSLQDESPPLKRLRTYIDSTIDAIDRHNTKNGCLLGNFSAEASGHSDIIRARLRKIYAEIQDGVQKTLKAAVKSGELSKNFKTEEMSEFIVASLQGAILLAKTRRDPGPLKNYRKILFGSILA